MDRYDQVFMETFDIGKESLGSDLTFQSIKEWDSVGHMALVAALEDEFDIVMETYDIIDFNSYEKGIEIIKKYSDSL